MGGNHSKFNRQWLVRSIVNRFVHMRTQPVAMQRVKLLLTSFLVSSAVISSAFSQTWTKTGAASNNWSSVAMSADGSRLVAVISGGGIYTSTNSGNNWVSNNAPVANWVSVASSADGSKLAALISGGEIYTSTNSGGTWTSSFTTGGTSIASSADGSILLVAYSSTSVNISTNSGAAFSKKTVSNSITEGVACASADGTILMTAAPFGVDISTNSGASWVSESGGNSMGETRGAAVSALGNMILAKADDGVYISTNGAQSFSNVFKGVPLSTAPSIAISADGKDAFITIGTSNLYYSTDFGAIWASNSTPSAFSFITSSADGNLLAAIGGGNIYTLFSPPAPALSLVPVGSNLVISWLVPSTNFVLQQNSGLTSQNWQTLTNAPTLNLTNLNNELVLRPTNDTGYYRLATP